VRAFLAGFTLIFCASCGDSSSVTAPPNVDAGTDAAQQPEAGKESGFDAPEEAEASSDTPEPWDVTPTPQGCVTEVSVGHHRFPCAGLQFDVEIPPSCAQGGCGLILDIHGMTMSADQEDKNTGLRALGIQHGFVVVQPTAAMTTMGPSWTPWIDDAKVWDFLADARAALGIDPRRVHVAGFSQGGAMTWRLICKHSDVIASAAPVAAADGSSWTATPPYVLDCPFTILSSPPAEIPLLQMHGKNDAVVPFAKGIDQRDAVIERWQMQEIETVSTDAQHIWKRYSNANGTVYEFVQHEYAVTPPLVMVVFGGHCMPGGTDVNTNPSPGQTMFFGCAPPTAFDWGEEIVKFFEAHPKP
jgi:polyhydroxybutyrate depolymerase